jgi:hypothetical protein
MPDKAAPDAAPRGRSKPVVEPLVVRPDVAFRLLSIGKTLGFAMLRDGRLERVQLGPRSVGVTMVSIKRLAGGGAEPPPEPEQPEPPRRETALVSEAQLFSD